MIDVTEDISRRTNETDKRFTYELLEFKEYNNFFPTPGDEVIGLEFLLAEPSCSDGLVEPFLGVSSASSHKCFGAEHRQDHKKISNGTKKSGRTGRQEEQHHWKDNYGHMQSSDEGILQEMNNLPSICEDYLFDCKLSEVSMFDCDSSKILCINRPSELMSENGKEYSASEGNCCNGSEVMVNESTIIYGDLATEAGRLCQPSAILNKKVNPVVMSPGKEPHHCDSIVMFSSMVNGGKLLQTENDVNFTQKRSRKRPRRYIDEYSKCHSFHTNKRSGGPSKHAKEKTACTLYLDCMKEVKEKKCVHYNEHITEAIQVPFGPSVLKHCSKKKASLLLDCNPGDWNAALVKFSEEITNTELNLNPSQDDKSDDYDLEEVTKDKYGRKHNRYWSEYEIARLIEGVARFGVGRWTEIKRGLFPPTTRRTSVDLKDKWRNLLKACRAHLHSTNEGRRIAHLQVSQSVLRQVKELAVMYPYPKISSGRMPL